MRIINKTKPRVFVLELTLDEKELETLGIEVNSSRATMRRAYPKMNALMTRLLAVVKSTDDDEDEEDDDAPTTNESPYSPLRIG